MLLLKAKFHKPSKKAQIKVIDNLMMVLSIIHPLTGAGQAVDIFVSQNASGVSLFTWVGFLVMG